MDPIDLSHRNAVLQGGLDGTKQSINDLPCVGHVKLAMTMHKIAKGRTNNHYLQLLVESKRSWSHKLVGNRPMSLYDVIWYASLLHSVSPAKPRNRKACQT